jgi:outer membrane immunogenic protein
LNRRGHEKAGPGERFGDGPEHGSRVGGRPRQTVYKAAPAAIAPLYNWSGFYIGIAGGGAWGRSDQFALGVPVTNGYDVNGGLIGGMANWQAESWVFGLEGDFSWADKRGSGQEIPPFNTAAIAHTREKSGRAASTMPGTTGCST